MSGDVRFSVLQRASTELEIPEENASDDTILINGIKFDGLTSLQIYRDGDDIKFVDVSTSVVDLFTLSLGAGYGIAGRYALVLQHNGTVGDGTFFGYSNLINGLDTPIVIPRDSTLKDLSFSNPNASADYTIYLRKNSSTATAFHTITKTNTDNFVELDIDESFTSGDTIYLEYQDDGTNASDVGIVLFFRND